MSADKIMVLLAIAAVAAIVVLAGYAYKICCERDDLLSFKTRYRSQMSEMWRWFASDPCSLLVLGYLDHQLDGGIADPAGNTRDERVFQGIQAVRQAIRDCHFNDKLKAQAEAACVVESARPRFVPDEITPMNIEHLIAAHLPGIPFTEYLAVCLAEIFKGGAVNIYHVSKQEQDAVGNLVDGETRIYKITDMRGNQLWPSMYGSDESSSAEAHDPASMVHVTYHEQPLTYEEKLDLILKGVQECTARIREGAPTPTTNIVLDGSIARSAAVHMSMRDLVAGTELRQDEFTPRPSGWAVIFRRGPEEHTSWLTVLDGFTHDSRKALIFGSKEAAQASSATINSDRPQYITRVAWVVYDGAEQRYVEHPMP